ncbi:exported hypothetical protein [Vibrio nigripulchritudo MADA3029]|nr:exported hypothetical protein [Vibrio nigripulchritudo AM115]CCN40908.1 exported hypothetical protein [Vibrio nigripulchritudo FTn2]CCN46080.1 exported hypothetical protein [Vibrio nigripulchritudo MADA3020]CCN51696.1 exported hypothetical protein [Vibrio nigripulchritudo MADA3021]CCN61860.1 exported hypothetical protein [Vibrio nigripulchritudo MADA3029]CCN63616.1 exported hypothetical protein [Vibrio nigripulchritudo POn4]CCN78352.1 exported hypothetical protein [Vibrio nigripulchritudo 
MLTVVLVTVAVATVFAHADDTANMLMKANEKNQRINDIVLRITMFAQTSAVLGFAFPVKSFVREASYLRRPVAESVLTVEF